LQFLSKYIICLCLISCFIVASPQAFAAGEGGLDIDSLKAGVGARPLGMGGAFTAIANNADAPYWNPAGLARINFSEINTMQTRMSTDADHYYLSYVQPLGRGSLGVSWIQVSLGSITETTTTDAFNEVINISTFSYFSNAFLLAYGLPLNDKVAIGLTAKYLTSDMTMISQGQATGYSVTPAVLITPNNRLSIGAKVDEIFNEVSWGTGTVERAPAKARVGISYLLDQVLGRLPLTGRIALDLAQTLQSGFTTEYSAGYEWERDGLALRLGYADTALTAGAGFKSPFGNNFGVAELDYAYVQQTSISKDNVHRISLAGKW